MLTLIGLVVSSVVLLQGDRFAHWPIYFILFVYLGGLLVLFLYFTTSTGPAKVPRAAAAIAAVTICWGLTLTEGATSAYGPRGITALFLFAAPQHVITLGVLFLLVLALLAFISLTGPAAGPMRQTYARACNFLGSRFWLG